MSAHAIMISFEGIPAIYFNSMFGTSNDEAKYIITGNNRDLNRYKWNYKNISKKLDNKNSKQSIFLRKISNLLRVRKKTKSISSKCLKTQFKSWLKFFFIQKSEY